MPWSLPPWRGLLPAWCASGRGSLWPWRTTDRCVRVHPASPAWSRPRPPTAPEPHVRHRHAHPATRPVLPRYEQPEGFVPTNSQPCLGAWFCAAACASIGCLEPSTGVPAPAAGHPVGRIGLQGSSPHSQLGPTHRPPHDLIKPASHEQRRVTQDHVPRHAAIHRSLSQLGVHTNGSLGKASRVLADLRWSYVRCLLGSLRFGLPCADERRTQRQLDPRKPVPETSKIPGAPTANYQQDLPGRPLSLPSLPSYLSVQAPSLLVLAWGRP